MAGYPLGLRNNNPGNIIATGDNWQGEIGTNQGFVVFQDIPYGIRAMIKVLQYKISEGLVTVEDIIYSYAPPSQNDTEAYISRVCQVSGLTRSSIIQATSGSLRPLMKGIMDVELGHPYASYIDDSDIDEGFALLGWDLTPGEAAAGGGVVFLLLLAALYALATMPTIPKKKAAA